MSQFIQISLSSRQSQLPLPSRHPLPSSNSHDNLKEKVSEKKYKYADIKNAISTKFFSWDDEPTSAILSAPTKLTSHIHKSRSRNNIVWSVHRFIVIFSWWKKQYLRLYWAAAERETKSNTGENAFRQSADLKPKTEGSTSSLNMAEGDQQSSAGKGVASGVCQREIRRVQGG